MFEDRFYLFHVHQQRMHLLQERLHQLSRQQASLRPLDAGLTDPVVAPLPPARRLCRLTPAEAAQRLMID